MPFLNLKTTKFLLKFNNKKIKILQAMNILRKDANLQ